MRYSHPPLINPVIKGERSIFSWSIGKFLVLIGTFVFSLLLAGSVVATYKIASSYLNKAYSRNAQVRAMAQAYEVNQLLMTARHELEYLSRMPMEPDLVLRHFNAKVAKERNRYREVAYRGKTVEDGFILVNTGETMLPVAVEQTSETKFGMVFNRDQLTGKPTGFVQVGEPVEVVYPSVQQQGAVHPLTMQVIRLTMPVLGVDHAYNGLLTLSVDLHRVRDIISLHASTQSPLFLFPQESEQKKSFFFDKGGWLLFQSESLGNMQPELSVDSLRVGLQGDVGRPGFNTAFRPGFEYQLYWSMVTDVQGGKPGQMMVGSPFVAPESTGRTLYLSYIPIVFHEGGQSVKIVGGIGCIDASFVYMASTYQVAGMLAIGFGVSIVLGGCAMYWIGRRICKPLEVLAEAVETRVTGDDSSPVALSPLFAEIDQFQKSINVLLHQVQIARNDWMLRKNFQEDDRMRQVVDLEKELGMNQALDHRILAMPLLGIVGGGPSVAGLRQKIEKAARVMADVLVIGETGTGKELTAEAIHLLSQRSKGPFISINCGALDENLLLDALFGHVQGAFSEARGERKGAFVAASGGTLHLDEIDNASEKVQQALLRALSVRCVRPLGSDRDVAFDARIVAATNVDLLQLSLAGGFREDLYYRLAVITIHLVPLRQRKEDIPALIRHYLQEQARTGGKPPVRISRGALERLVNHDWPGNIRELKNCITRSLAFTESDVLLAEHILFDERNPTEKTVDQEQEEPLVLPPRAADFQQAERARVGDDSSALRDEMPDCDMNRRQRRAWPVIVRNGGTSRLEYQQAVGEDISVRTAQYDLQDLVAKKVLIKKGRGPSSRYFVP